MMSSIGSVRIIRMHSTIYRRRSVESGKHDTRQRGLVLARSVMMYAMLIDTFLESRARRQGHVCALNYGSNIDEAASHGATASLSRLWVKDGKNGPTTSMSSLMYGVRDRG